VKSPIDIFAEGARDGAYPGGQLAASRDGKLLVSASVGVLGPRLERTNEDVIYDLASLTKPLATSLMIGRAIEEKRCTIEDPVARFIPGRDRAVTLQHLLEHSSGYPAHDRFDRTLPATLRPGTWDAWRHIIFEAAKTPREVPPGVRVEYSDLGYILLGAALEIIFSKPLSMGYALLGTPLFFRDTRGPPALPLVRGRWPIAPTEGCLVGQVHDENARAMGGAAGHAGLWGNALSVLRLCEQLVLAYHGWQGGLLKPQTVRRLWSPSKIEGSTRTLGWDRPSPVGASTGGRWPLTSVGHLGFTGTSVWIEPERSLIVVLVTNRVCPTRANNMIRRLRPLLYDAAWEAWSRPRTVSAERTDPEVRAHSKRDEEHDTEPKTPVYSNTPDPEKTVRITIPDLKR
jgi:CubicO group peptidase (beta-lactamase class C family)